MKNMSLCSGAMWIIHRQKKLQILLKGKLAVRRQSLEKRKNSQGLWIAVTIISHSQLNHKLPIIILHLPIIGPSTYLNKKYISGYKLSARLNSPTACIEIWIRLFTTFWSLKMWSNSNKYHGYMLLSELLCDLFYNTSFSPKWPHFEGNGHNMCSFLSYKKITYPGH